MSKEISNYDDIIDSREVIERIEELTAEFVDATETDPADVMSEDDWASGLGEDGAHELVALIELAEQASGYAADWQYGETLIRDSYFETYAQELAEGIGAIDPDAGWPNGYIDWERAARELQMDYTSVEFDGETYWIR